MRYKLTLKYFHKEQANFKRILLQTHNSKIKIDTYKDFHIFVCMSVIKIWVTDLVLKDKTLNIKNLFDILRKLL